MIWEPSHLGPLEIAPGAIDLKQRYNGVHNLFAGVPELGVYPPASYVILWPLLGWLEIRPAVLMWAATTVFLIGWLVVIVVKESGAKAPLDRLFVGFVPLSMYATGATIGNGQLVVHILPVLISGILLLRHQESAWGNDILAACLILASLVKPAISAPFFWIILFVPRRLRPALLVSLGYVLLTLFAAAFQEEGIFSLIRNWLSQGSSLAITSGKGHANIHIGLAALDLKDWILPASLFLLALLGVWTFYHRHVDIWYLMGVAAIFARFWVYHRWYDDLLILLPMVSLLRVAKRGPCDDGSDVAAGVLFGVCMLFMLAPGGYYLLPEPWKQIYVNFQIIVWIMVLLFLIYRSHVDPIAQTPQTDFDRHPK